MAYEERRKSRRISVTGGIDGRVQTEEREYQVDYAEIFGWELKLGEQHPTNTNMHITNIDIEPTALGPRGLVRVTYSTAGLGPGETDTGKYHYSFRSYSSRKREAYTCPTGPHDVERDLLKPLASVRLVSWETSPLTGPMLGWVGRINSEEYGFGGRDFLAGTLLFTGGEIDQMGATRWRHVWNWLYDYTTWEVKCERHDEILGAYPEVDMGPILGKVEAGEK